jgi:hypothetical protein
MAFFFSFFSFEKYLCAERSEALQLSTRSHIRQEEMLIFKSYVMLNFIIKTHKKGIIYAKPHLFILNKGMNSGKPQKEPFTNSFVIIFQNECDCESLYFIAYSLWQTKFWHQYLVGSVIPFLRLPDFKKEFNPKATALMKEHEEHQKNVAALKLLENQEKQFHQNINLINDLRRVILYRYCNNR